MSFTSKAAARRTVSRRCALVTVASVGTWCATPWGYAQTRSPTSAARGSAVADAWPTAPIHYVVPFSPGGSTDTIARVLAQHLPPLLGQPVIVENVTGSGGAVGAAQVAKAKPDGYTVLGGTISTHAINPSVYKNLPYHPISDFEPITLVAFLPNVLLVGTQHGVNSVSDLVALLKRDPASRTFASSGAGTSQHLCGEVFADKVRIPLRHVPFKGTPPAMADVASGKVTFLFDQMTAATPLIKAGKLRALAVTTRKGTPLMRDLPTMFEAGIQNFEVSSWQAIYAPKNTPALVVRRLNNEITKVLRQPEVKGSLRNEFGMEVIGSGPDELAVWMKLEIPRWAFWAQRAGVAASL